MQKKLSLSIITRNKFSLMILLFICFFHSIKSFALLEEVATAKNKIHITKSTYLEIRSTFSKECFDEHGYTAAKDCKLKNELFLNKNQKNYDFSKLLTYWKHDLVYFVKLVSTSYSSDLDKDGNIEFAIYPMIAGNNTITDAYLYSLKGTTLTFYGMGKFNFELGKHVISIEKDKWVKPCTLN